MKIATFLPYMLAIGLALPLQAMATAVPAYSSNPTKPVIIDLGEYQAGNYLLSGSGLIDLAVGMNVIFKPDGLPFSSPSKYPDGTYAGDYGVYGPAGLNGKIGSLIGSFSANPLTSNDWFQIGYSKYLTLDSTQHIYAAVNETFYTNNSGAFEVTVMAAVPEPQTYAMLLAGIGLLGWTARRKRKRKQS